MSSGFHGGIKSSHTVEFNRQVERAWLLVLGKGTYGSVEMVPGLETAEEAWPEVNAQLMM